MKKQTKLLAILLTLVMLIGVFAIGASAYGFNYTAAQAEKITGESFVSYSNFNNSTVKEYVGTGTNKTGSFTKQNANAGQTLGFQADDDATQIYIVQSEKDGTDRYIQIKNETAAAATSSFYLKLATGVGNTSPLSTAEAKDAFLNSGNTLKDIKYYVLDFDVFFPTGELSIAPTFGFYFRGYGSDGARGDLRYNASKKLGYYGSQYLIKFTDAGDDIVVQSTNSYASNGSYGYSEGTALSKDEWSHISIVVESVPVTKGSTPALDIKCYTVLNGEIIYVHTFEAPAESYAQNWMNGDMTGVFVQQLQFNIPKIGVGDVVNIDNVALRAYDRTTYTDTLAANLGAAGTDITGWDRDSYDADLMPFGNAVASVGETEYDSIAKAVKAADEGATIEMIKSTDVNVVIDKPLTINLNGKTVTGVSAAAGFEIVEGDGTITVQAQKSPAVAKIGDTEYESLADAIAAAENGDTITLYANVDEAITVGKEITIAYNNFTVTGYTIAPEYCESVTSTAEQLVIKSALYEIKNGDGTITYSDGEFNSTVRTAFNKGNSTVKLLQDVNYTSAGAQGYINMYTANLTFTLDLNGHTLNITQGITGGTKAEFLLNAANIHFTVTGGEDKMGAINVTNASGAYHLFRANQAGTTLVLKNLNVTGGTLYHNGAKANSALTIDNSTFNAAKASNTYIITATNTIDFAATNSKFNLQTNTLIMSQAPAGSTADNYRCDFDFTNCDIYSGAMNNAERKNLFTCINAYTYVTFTGCNIVGSLKPATNSSQINNSIPAATAANIILGGGTTLSTDSAYTASVVDGLSLIQDGVLTYTFSMSGIDDIEYTIGYVVTEYTAAQIGNVKYQTLADAIEAAGESDIITLMANITESITVGKEITIDYNGFTVTGITLATNYCESVSSTAEQLVIKKAVFEVTRTDGTTYLTDESFYTVINSITNSARKQVKLLQDVTHPSSATIYVKRSFTIDLNGYTLNIIQSMEKTSDFTIQQLSASSFPTFTITNGTINVSNIHAANSGSTFPVFTLGTGASTLKLTFLTVNSGPLIYNYNNKSEPKIILEDSSFNLTTSGRNTTGGLIETRANTTVTAERCKIYLEASYLLASMHFNGLTDAAELSSTYTFTDCDIYSTHTASIRVEANTSNNAKIQNCLLGVANGYTTISFNGCNLYGNIQPVMHYNDFNSGNKLGIAPTNDTVILGEGTTLSSGATYNATTPKGYAVLADGVSTYTFSIAGIDDIEYIIGYVVMEYTAAQIGDVKYLTLAEAIEAAGESDIITLMANITESITVGKEITITYNGFTLTGYTIAPEYCESISSTASQLVIKKALYKLTNTNGVFYSDADFYDIVTEAKGTAGSVVLLLQDVNYTSSSPIYIQSSITIDLGNHTLNITQGIAAKSAEFRVQMADLLTVMNGTINVTNSSAYTLFRFDAEGAQLSVIDLDITAGNMFYNTYANVTVNISDSTFNLTKVSGNRFITSTNSIDFTATNSKIYLSTNTLIMSQAGAGATADNYHSTFDFTNCDIYREGMNTSNNAERANIFTCNNGYTYTTFTGCNIVGSIKPATNSTQSNNKIPVATAANVILGEGTTLSADSAYVASIKDGYFGNTATRTYTFTLGDTTVTYNVALTVERNLITITWYKEDGVTVILTQDVPYGTVGLTPPNYTPGNNNGWFNTTFEGWTTVNGSTDKIDLVAFVVEANASFYPAIKADAPPTAYLKGAEYNLTLTGNITVNFYLPIAPEGLTVTGVYDAITGNTIAGKRVILPSDEERVMYVAATVSASELTTVTKIQVRFTVNHNGQDYELTQNVTLSPIKYATSVLKSAGQTEATKTLIVDMIRYSNTLAIATKGASVTELDDLLDQYGEYCSELPTDNDFAEYTTSVNNLKGYIETISFEVSEYQPRWRFTFTEAMKVVDVQITLDGYFELPDENGYNFGSLTYDLNTTDSSYSGNYLTVAYIENIPMYNVDKVITITVTTEDGEVREGTYSLNVYYANMGQGSDLTKEELSKYRDFLKTFRAFGITSAGYRYPEGMKKKGAATVEFINCDHPNVTNRSMNATNNNNGILCPDCQTYVFFYEVYIKNNIRNTYASIQEAFDNNYNAYTQIYLCHSKANTRAAAGYKVGCYAGNYNFYLGTAQLSANIGTISVKTDTNWNGAYFLVDDSIFNVSDLSYEKPLFNIQGLNTTIDGTTYQNGGGVDITDQLVANLNAVSGKRIINANAKNIGWSNGMPMMIELLDYSQTRYHREGANASKAATHEVILIDEFGNVNPTTPIEWDYIYTPNWNKVTPGSAGTDNEVIAECSFKAVAYPISTAPITISGLDSNGNINCTFETKPNQTNIDMTSFNACMRGIQISTSNVTIQGLEHIMNEDPNLPRQTYKGFIIVTFANNTTVKDIIVDQHSPQTTTDGTYMGSYELNASDSINTSWINCRSSAFFDANGNVSTNGMFGTNRIRNSYLKNCVLISFDAHTAAYNVTIEDSTFAHINLIGAGDIVLNNVVVYADASYSGIILRRDYGSRWEGNVYVDGLELRHSNAYDKDYVDLVRAQYTNHDFGFQDQTATSGNYLPTEVHAKNVTITQYTRTTQAYTCTAPGIVDEVTTASDKRLGILAWYSESLYEYYPTFYWNDDNNQTVTEAFYIEGGCVDSLEDLYLPKHSKLKSIVIEINGVKQTWA